MGVSDGVEYGRGSGVSQDGVGTVAYAGLCFRGRGVGEGGFLPRIL